MTIKHKHDLLFRKALENPLVAAEFFDTHLPTKIKELWDPNSLKLEKESFVESSLKSSISDVLFTAKFNNEDGYLYLLLEHQSKPDPLMGFRLFKYMLNICDRHLTMHPGSKQLPLVYPLIFYNGKQRYNVARNMWDLFSDSSLTKEIWTNDYQLINLQEIPDEELTCKLWAGIMQFFMKHIRDRNLLKAWEEIADKLPALTKIEFGFDYIKILLVYTLTNMKEADKIGVEKLLYKKLGKTRGGKIMVSIAEKWYQDGRVEGKAEGKAEEKEKTVLNMLKQGLDINLIKQITGFSLLQINQLKTKIRPKSKR